MALVAQDLADAITVGMGFELPSPAPILGFATGLVEALQLATASFNNGTPIHAITAIDAAAAAQAIADAAPYPSVTPELEGFVNGMIGGFQSGVITYSGPPPPAVPDFFLNGVFSGLSGASMAAAAGFPSVTPELLAFCNAVATYVQANAEIELGVIS